MNSIFLTVKHDFCSLDTLPWVLHNHIRSPFKVSRNMVIFLQSEYLSLCSSNSWTAISYPYLIVSPFHVHVFSRHIGPICGAKWVTFPGVRAWSQKPSFPPFWSGFWKLVVQVSGNRGKGGCEKANWGARWRGGKYTIPPFSEWSLNRGVLWSPSHTLSWGQAGEKKHLCA
jgi:hypothetical protein